MVKARTTITKLWCPQWEWWPLKVKNQI